MVRPIALILALHAFALGLMFTFEADWVSKLAFLSAWGILNCFLAGAAPPPRTGRGALAGR